MFKVGIHLFTSLVNSVLAHAVIGHLTFQDYSDSISSVMVRRVERKSKTPTRMEMTPDVAAKLLIKPPSDDAAPRIQIPITIKKVLKIR